MSVTLAASLLAVAEAAAAAVATAAMALAMLLLSLRLLAGAPGVVVSAPASPAVGGWPIMLLVTPSDTRGAW
jgi:hypothetical protein